MVALVFALGLALGAEPQAPAATQNPPPSAEAPLPDPYGHRPVCESMFLTSDWQLSPKQTACDWIQNRVFSTPALLGAVWSAETTPLWNRLMGRSDDGSGFSRRFVTNFGQNASKSTGAFLGGLLFHEDPRVAPPYLILQREPRPRGFWKRTAHALEANFVSYRCEHELGSGDTRQDHDCRTAGDVHLVPAVSRVTGSLASGYALAFLEPSATDMRTRALRGAASAYAATFANSLFVEFKPELSAFAGKALTAIFGVR